jgi:hypothetical protein
MAATNSTLVLPDPFPTFSTSRLVVERGIQIGSRVCNEKDKCFLCLNQVCDVEPYRHKVDDEGRAYPLPNKVYFICCSAGMFTSTAYHNVKICGRCYTRRIHATGFDWIFNVEATCERIFNVCKDVMAHSHLLGQETPENTGKYFDEYRATFDKLANDELFREYVRLEYTKRGGVKPQP